VLEAGTVSTNVFLRRIHNFALDVGWLPWPVIVTRQRPSIHFQEKRAVTLEEHQAIIEREKNPEWRAFYALLWHLGGAQSEVATLRAEDVDWSQQIISYSRKKTGTISHVHFEDEVETILASRPSVGPLFPKIALTHEKHRAKLFRRRCLGLGIYGVSLHSYRYAWAERAKVCGYPERFAQEALGHNSNAVHRAYAPKAKVKLPSLEGYERRSREAQVIAMPLPNGAAVALATSATIREAQTTTPVASA